MSRILEILVGILLLVVLMGWLYLSNVIENNEYLKSTISNYKTEVATMENTIESQAELCLNQLNIKDVETKTLEELEEELNEEFESFKFTASEKTDSYTIEVGSKMLTLNRVSPKNTECLHNGEGWIFIDSEVLQ